MFHDRRFALAAAVILTAAAGLAWRDAYETRGRRRPIWAKLAGAAL